MLAPPAGIPRHYRGTPLKGTRYTRPKAYHSVDDDGSRDVSPLDFLNPLQRGTPPGGGYAKRGGPPMPAVHSVISPYMLHAHL